MTGQAISAPANLWAVILAGEDGTDLQTRSSGSSGADRSEISETPGRADSLLRPTLSRTRLAVPLERTVIVANRLKDVHLAAEFPTPGTPRMVMRPERRGSAADVLLAVYWIRRQEPSAAVGIFPSEQVVLEPYAFMQHVAEVASFVERNDREIVLIGARPTYPDTRYGWIEPAEAVSDTGTGSIRRVRDLRGSLPYSLARARYESGCLWNTSVVVARAEAIVRASRRSAPELDARLQTAVALIGTSYERRALEDCYSTGRESSFSEVVLEATLRQLSVSCLPPIHWSAREGSGPALRRPRPRGRFDGIVEQHTLRDNVQACRAVGSTSSGSPWRAEPWDPERPAARRGGGDHAGIH